jgi:hypothetical protein
MSQHGHNLNNLFKHHPPVGEADIKRYERIRAAGKAFAQVVVDNTPACADQSAAVRKIREAVMTSNAAVACFGDPLTPLSPAE